MSDKLSELWDYWSAIEKETDQMNKTLEDHVAFLEHLADSLRGIYTDIDMELGEVDGADGFWVKLMEDVSDELFDMRAAIHRRIDELNA